MLLLNVILAAVYSFKEKVNIDQLLLLHSIFHTSWATIVGHCYQLDVTKYWYKLDYIKRRSLCYLKFLKSIFYNFLNELSALIQRASWKGFVASRLKYIVHKINQPFFLIMTSYLITRTLHQTGWKKFQEFIAKYFSLLYIFGKKTDNHDMQMIFLACEKISKF